MNLLQDRMGRERGHQIRVGEQGSTTGVSSLRPSLYIQRVDDWKIRTFLAKQLILCQSMVKLENVPAWTLASLILWYDPVT